MKRPSKKVAGLISSLGVAILFPSGAMPWIEGPMIKEATISPDASSGHVVPYNNHGTTVYLRSWQSLLINGAIIGVFVGFGLLGLGAVLVKDQKL